MNFLIPISLNTTPEQYVRLCELRAVFAQVCNRLAPAVQASRVWNRVTLHHLHYHSLREQFPDLGSQMVCNAIYAVSKMARLVYQHPKSPYNLASRGDAPLPLLRFAGNCPVYFDRHTLTIKAEQLSLFTMDGRMHFELTLAPAKRVIFEQAKLREIALKEDADHRFKLSFFLESETAVVTKRLPEAEPAKALFPDYVSVEVAQ